MNAYELAELRQELKSKGITVKQMPTPDHITYELVGHTGKAYIGRTPDGEWYARWSEHARHANGGRLRMTYEQCLATVLEHIA